MYSLLKYRYQGQELKPLTTAAAFATNAIAPWLLGGIMGYAIGGGEALGAPVIKGVVVGFAISLLSGFVDMYTIYYQPKARITATVATATAITPLRDTQQQGLLNYNATSDTNLGRAVA
jgi:hypothetical protein